MFFLFLVSFVALFETVVFEIVVNCVEGHIFSFFPDSILLEGERCASEVAEQNLVEVKKMVGLL
jgi:hypothetical protein